MRESKERTHVLFATNFSPYFKIQIRSCLMTDTFVRNPVCGDRTGTRWFRYREVTRSLTPFHHVQRNQNTLIRIPVDKTPISTTVRPTLSIP
jgi:hypothetical protein